MKTNFGNKEANDKAYPFNTMTAQANHRMKDFQQIIICKILVQMYYSSLGVVLKSEVFTLPHLFCMASAQTARPPHSSVQAGLGIFLALLPFKFPVHILA